MNEPLKTFSYDSLFASPARRFQVHNDTFEAFSHDSFFLQLRRGDCRYTTILFNAFSWYHFSHLRRGDFRYSTILFKAFQYAL